MKVYLRQMIPNDVVWLHEIDSASHADPLDAQDFGAICRRPEVRGVMAEARAHPAGFALYVVAHRERLSVIRFGVAPEMRRKRVGTQLVAQVKAEAARLGVPAVRFLVRESSLDMQLFLRSAGFVGAPAERGYYRDTGEDAYSFTHEVDTGQGAVVGQAVS